jgi:hypothetical protein
MNSFHSLLKAFPPSPYANGILIAKVTSEYHTGSYSSSCLAVGSILLYVEWAQKTRKTSEAAFPSSETD